MCCKLLNIYVNYTLETTNKFMYMHTHTNIIQPYPAGHVVLPVTKNKSLMAVCGLKTNNIADGIENKATQLVFKNCPSERAVCIIVYMTMLPTLSLMIS